MSTRESIFNLGALGVTALAAHALEQVTGAHGFTETAIAAASLAGALTHASFGHVGLEFVHSLTHRFTGEHPARNRENHDLHRLIGQTIAHVLDHTDSTGDLGWLDRTTDAFRGGAWMDFQPEGPEIAISEPNIAAFFTGDPESIKTTPVLDPAAWRTLIEKVAPVRPREAAEALDRAAAALSAHFAGALWESAKHAWKSNDLAAPALVLHLLSHVAGNTAQLPQLRAEIEALRTAVLQQATPALAAAPPADVLVQAINDYSARIEAKLDRLQTDVTAIRQAVENRKLAPTRERWIALPNPTTEILARDREAESLLAALRAPSPAILSIAAPPGFGKTAVLALALSKFRAAGDPPDTELAGIAMHSATEADPPALAPLANLIGRITGLQDAAARFAEAGPHPNAAVRALFFDFLAQAGPVWLIVDNAEVVLAPANQAKFPGFHALLEEWTSHRHAVNLLLVSRNAPKPALKGHRRLTDIEHAILGGLPIDDAVTVLRNNLAETRFHNAPDALLRQVAERLHRVPMALEQFATYLKDRAAVLELNQHFIDANDLLRLDKEDQLPRIIRENLDLLDEPSLYLLGVVAWAAMPVPRSGLLALNPDTALHLTKLVQSNQLLVIEGTIAEGRRFDTHPLIREALADVATDTKIPAHITNAFLDAGNQEWRQAQYLPALALFTLLDRAARITGDRRRIADATNSRGTTLDNLNRLDEAVAANDDAIALFRMLVEAEGHSELRNDLATAIMNRAVSLRQLGRLGEAVAANDETIAIRRALVETEGRLELRNDLAMAIMDRGVSLRKLGRLDESVAAYDEAIAIFRTLIETEGQRELRDDLASAIINRAVSLRQLGRLDEAASACDDATALYRTLVETERRRELRVSLARANIIRGNSLVAFGRLDEAVAAYDDAITLYRTLVETEGRRELRHEVAGAIMNRAISLQNLGRLDDAVAAYDDSIALYRTLVETEGRRELRNDLARASMNRAVSLDNLGRLDEAVAAYDDAIAIRRTLVEIEGRRELRPDLAMALYNLAFTRECQGALPAALAVAREARQLWQACVNEGMHHLQPDLDDAKSLEARLARP